MDKNLEKNLTTIKNEFDNSKDIIVKKVKSGKTKCAVVYMLGLNDTIALSEFVIMPLIRTNVEIKDINTVIENILPLSEIEEQNDDKEINSAIMKGKAILLIDGIDTALVLAVDKMKERAIMEPPTSTVLKGPRSGFVENLKTNLSILRKILASTKLKNLSTSVGKHTDTAISILYIDGIADNEVVENVKKKIENINIDGVIDSFYIAQFLEERKDSMFKQVGTSEKPDIIAAKLLEGRVAILVDGSPIALTVPFIYIEDLQSGDDYYSNHARASFVRWIRIMSVFITILTPAVYIAIVLHHYKAIPLKFLITIVNSTRGLPLTPFAEILFVLILFEILYEASLRMPKYLGMALSIVGALILGDTAVKAGLISPPSVMIVAVSGLSIYCIPDQAPQLYILRMLFTLAGGMLGFFGITALMIFLIAYLSDFDSYGSAYFAPVAPFVEKDIKDALYKADITNSYTRPTSIANNRKNLKRQAKHGRKNNFK